MSDALTAVIDRNDQVNIPQPRKSRRVWFIILASFAALALTVSATFSVHFYLTLQEQRRLSANQAEQLASLAQTLSAQSEQLVSQQAQLSQQESALSSQQSVIDEQQSTIEKQQKTIEEQKETISALSPKEIVKGVASYPDINITGLKDKKLVALTFDDGPSQYTAKLLDALKQHNAKATFFIVGSRLGGDSSNALIQRMDAEGHVVGNHSQNHKNLKLLSSKGIANEMFAASKRIKNLIGHYPIVMRCPGGNYNNTVLSYAKSIHTPIIQWSLDTVDWRDRNKNTVINRVKNGVTDGSIVLMHDLYSTTVDACVELIPYLQEQGYTLVTVPELLAAKQGQIKFDKVYYKG